ncbi:hypothetical protein PINS_up000374 [Pythium insidiosum]|nr:hypothetical protein PINS_up000374 [Pythium insidiosum]
MASLLAARNHLISSSQSTRMVWAVPNADAVTLGELNGELYSVTPRDEMHLGSEFVRRGGAVFSPARVTGLKQRRPFGQQESLTEESDGDAMEPHALRLAKRLTRMLRLFFVADERRVARELVASAKWIVDCVPFVRPLGDDREDASAFVDAKARRINMEETIATMAWHPTLSVLAVAQRDGVVTLYDVSTGRWDARVLEHVDQQDITSIQWARLTGGMLAVAARGAIFLWSISCKNSGKEPDLVNVIKHPSAKTISMLSWNEDGSLLAAVSEQSKSVLVIDVTYDRCTELLCHDRVTSIHWSPTGEYLFVPTAGGTSVMWEACTWTKEIWNVATESCAWSNNGQCLLLAPRNKALIYPYEMRAKPPSMDVAINAPAIEFAEKQVYSLDRSTFEYVGGKVVSMTWDPSNTRVAVTYSPSSSSDGDVGPLVVIYSVAWSPFLIISKSGFVRGPVGCGRPRCVTFASSFEQGSLLSVAWSSGLITFHPFYFEADS